MDTDTLLWVLEYQKPGENYCDIAAAALMMYDYTLTLHLEIKLIWIQSPWNHVKILYLLTRYLAILTVLLLLYIQLFPGVSEQACAAIFPTTTWLSIIVVNLAETILCIRTWAVYRQNACVGIGLILLMVGAFISECYYLHIMTSSIIIAPRPFPEYVGCFRFASNGQLLFWICFVVLSVVEFAVLLLMAISAFRSYKSGNSSELSNVIHRDGIMFYVYLLALTVTNVVAIRVLHHDMLILPQTVLYSILTTRIILNIRRVALQKEGTVLDVTNPLVFGARTSTLEDLYWVHSMPETRLRNSVELGQRV